MDPSKMAAWANDGKGGGMKPGADEMDAAAGEELDEGMEDELAGQEADEEAETDLGALFAALEEDPEAVEAASDELDGDMLADTEMSELPGEEVQILTDGLNALPPKLRKTLAKFSGMSREDAQKAADHLYDEELIGDADRVAGWLFHAVQHA